MSTWGGMKAGQVQTATFAMCYVVVRDGACYIVAHIKSERHGQQTNHDNTH